ncbi:MAG: hypothetical protein LBI43_07970 [Streptococcaceae bacterium]|jgi:membrane protease YdiL (CAAX protease family)|nr:hypothetical protein [Streptococcaceae bacterium]
MQKNNNFLHPLIIALLVVLWGLLIIFKHSLPLWAQLVGMVVLIVFTVFMLWWVNRKVLGSNKEN